MAQTQRVSGVATSIVNARGWTSVYYYGTEVVGFTSPEQGSTKIIRLNSGGWRSATTRTRMNQASRQFNLGFSVFQRDSAWYVNLPNGETIPFQDHLAFSQRT